MLRASGYHDAARELTSAVERDEPKLTDREKMNLEIYAERQNDLAERERYLELARGERNSEERDISLSRGL